MKIPTQNREPETESKRLMGRGLESKSNLQTCNLRVGTAFPGSNFTVKWLSKGFPGVKSPLGDIRLYQHDIGP